MFSFRYQKNLKLKTTIQVYELVQVWDYSEWADAPNLNFSLRIAGARQLAVLSGKAND